jgi:hypothetical protein
MLAAVVGLLHAALLLTLWWARAWWRTGGFLLLAVVAMLLVPYSLTLHFTSAWGMPLWGALLILTSLHLIVAWLLLRPASTPCSNETPA